MASLAVVVVGGLAGRMQWVVSSTIAPLRSDIQGINGRLDGRLDRMDVRMDRMETSIAAVREDVDEGFRMFGERLTRVETLIETLLERSTGESGASDTTQ